MGENTTKYHYKFQMRDNGNQIQVIPILIVVFNILLCVFNSNQNSLFKNLKYAIQKII